MDELFFMLFAVFVGSIAIQTLFLWVVFFTLALHKQKETSNSQLPPVSIVISARNEVHNLDRFLPAVLEQDYPEYEVVLVNDHSDDESEYILKIYAERFPQLKIVNLNHSVSFSTGKKFPLSIGIKSAKYEHVLLTDADCRVNKQWAKQMMSSYSDIGTDIVLSYGAYSKHKGLLNKLIRYYAFFTAEQYLSFAAIKRPYMGVGRNLSYSKHLFFAQGGFISHYHIPSGDDDLFVNKAANSKNTSICLEPSAFTYSEPKKNLSAWFRQKQRHISTGRYYKPWQRWTLSMYPFSLLMLLISGIILLSFGMYFWWVLGLLVFRYISFLLVQYLNLNKLKEKDLWVLSPLWELLIFAFNTFISIQNAIRPPVKWK